MTQEQFYFCLSKILELREKIEDTSNIRRKAQVTESALAEGHQVNFDSLRRFADNKEYADKNTIEAHAFIKELAAQEAKIRHFVPVSLYTTRIEIVQPGLPALYVVVEAQHINIKKAEK
jgi:hypothetical protein